MAPTLQGMKTKSEATPNKSSFIKDMVTASEYNQNNTPTSTPNNSSDNKPKIQKTTDKQVRRTSQEILIEVNFNDAGQKTGNVEAIPKENGDTLLKGRAADGSPFETTTNKENGIDDE